MHIRLLTGRDAGEIQDVRADAAHALIAAGSAEPLNYDRAPRKRRGGQRSPVPGATVASVAQSGKSDEVVE